MSTNEGSYEAVDSPDSENVVIIPPFRFIRPYEFTYVSHSKARWVNRTIVEVFTQEFRHMSKETVENRIRNGQITVNKKQIPVSYVIHTQDYICHTYVRREYPVYNQPILKLGETDDFIGFFKPASVQIQPTGGYLYNCMEKRVPKGLFPVHRLDKVTSGIVVMAKSEQAAKSFSDLLSAGSIHKKYIARVMGVFPEGETTVDAPILEDPKSNMKPICQEGGKPSRTIFRRLSTNGRESVVECVPVTGRIHQIRVHLSHIGFPISNDDEYGGKTDRLTSEEEKALKQAKDMGLWPPDAAVNSEHPRFVLQIYLQSVHYSSDSFSFDAPMPKWANLEESHSWCSVE